MLVLAQPSYEQASHTKACIAPLRRLSLATICEHLKTNHPSVFDIEIVRSVGECISRGTAGR